MRTNIWDPLSTFSDDCSYSGSIYVVKQQSIPLELLLFANNIKTVKKKTQRRYVLFFSVDSSCCCISLGFSVVGKIWTWVLLWYLMFRLYVDDKFIFIDQLCSRNLDIHKTRKTMAKITIFPAHLLSPHYSCEVQKWRNYTFYVYFTILAFIKYVE